MIWRLRAVIRKSKDQHVILWSGCAMVHPRGAHGSREYMLVLWFEEDNAQPPDQEITCWFLDSERVPRCTNEDLADRWITCWFSDCKWRRETTRSTSPKRGQNLLVPVGQFFLHFSTDIEKNRKKYRKNFFFEKIRFLKKKSVPGPNFGHKMTSKSSGHFCSAMVSIQKS